MSIDDIRKIKHYDLIQKMCLMDDEFMEVFFAGHNECVELVIRVILGRDDLIVKKSEIQKTVKGMRRSVRLDIFAVDTEGKRYNIEFQRLNSGAVPKRARFNASMIDVASLKKGDDFSKLPEVYVIFVTENDVLNEGRPLYTIDRVITESGNKFGDGSHIVYVNCEHKDSDTALGRLVHDFLCCESGKEFYYETLGDRTSYLKGEQEEVRDVSLLVDEYAKGLAEEAAAKATKEQQKISAIRMLELGKLALSEIAECSGLSLSTVRRMAKKLETAQ